MLPAADDLLVLMKQQVDLLLVGDSDLQALMSWVMRKTASAEITYKSATVRKYYFEFCLACHDIDDNRHHFLTLNSKLDLDLACDLSVAVPLSIGLSYFSPFPGHLADDLTRHMNRCFNIDFSRFQNIDLDYELAENLARNIVRASVFDHAHNRGIEMTLARALAHAFDKAYARTRYMILEIALSDALSSFISAAREYREEAEEASGEDCDLSDFFNDVVDIRFGRAIEQAAKTIPELQLKIEDLEAQLPDWHNHDVAVQWLNDRGEAWIHQLRKALIEHRNIGHDWQFTKVQKEKLQKYYDANQLLVDCLNGDRYVTKATQQYIEDTLLLPMSEIEKIPVHSH
jgi:hypothetical protein